MSRLLKADRVITGRPGESIKKGAVLEENGSIVWVGPQADYVPELAEKEAEILEFGSGTLMPGMIDTHVHLAFNGGPDPVGTLKTSSDRQILVTMLYNARLLLRSGVTTAREMGAPAFLDLTVKEAIEAETAFGPHLLVSTRPITTTGGHCWYMGCECDDAADIKKAVRENAKAGADLIKVMITGGFLTKGSAPWYCQFDLHEMQTAAYEAHRLDKKIAVHAHSTMGIQYAVKAGVDTIEHCSWLTSSGVDYDEKTAEELISKGIQVCLTANGRLKLWNDSRKEQWIAVCEKMRKLGVKFIAGTDAGIPNVRHDQYVAGLEALREYGLSNEEIIVSATSLAAEACGIGHLAGDLSQGKRADIIVVEGDPLKDISSLWKVDWIMKNGKIMDMRAV